jgi:hypothetical protein
MNKSLNSLSKKRNWGNRYIQRFKTTEQRFWEKVDKISSANGCWMWKNAIQKWNGYGTFFYNKRSRPAHRFSWEIHHGFIPNGALVLHNCPGGDNPACVNPDHLWLGNDAKNIADRDAKSRHAHGITHGMARLTESNVREIRILRSIGWLRKEIAKKFQVSGQHIADIVNGKRWKHI